MIIPEYISVRVLSDGTPVEGVLVKVVVGVLQKQSFASLHGPSDEQGVIQILKSTILRDAESDREFFLMDYGHPEADFSGDITIMPCDRDMLVRAMNAYLKYRDYSRFPEGYENFLNLSLDVLKQHPSWKLSLELIEQRGGMANLTFEAMRP